MAASLSAADLQQQHAAASGAHDPRSAAPMADPFPALTQDPFPAVPVATQAPVQEKTAARQPAARLDVDSQSAFPSLAAASTAAPAAGKWSQKLKPSASPAASGRSTPVSGTPGGWAGTAPVIQRTTFTDTFSIPIADDTLTKLGSVMQRVQQKLKHTTVEASTTRKTGTTTFVVKARNEKDLAQARKELRVLLAKNVTLTLMIPASLRAFVIGAKGKNLKSITEQTGVRVNIPPRDPAADAAAAENGAPGQDVDYEDEEQIPVTIEGDEINAKQAQSLIQAIVSERTSRTTQRLTHIDHIFYPFIGSAKANLEGSIGGGDVSVRVPPRAAFLPPKEAEEESAEPRRERDLSIIVTGDREAVSRVVAAIEKQVDDMKRNFRTLTISIPKRQHRFLVGDSAAEILASTSCSVELASIDDPSDSVTIRGPQAQLPLALTAAMEKANQQRVETVDLVSAHRGTADPLEHAKAVLRWLIRNGKLPRVQGVQVYTPRPAIIESTSTAVIEIVGADASEVGRVRDEIDGLVKRVPPSFVTIADIDPLLHRYLIGKKGQNLRQFETRGVDLVFPPEGDESSSILLLLAGASVVGSLPAEKKARDEAAAKVLQGVKEDLLKASSDAADLRTETLTIFAKHHRHIIGPNGSVLNALIGEDRAVSVKVGPPKAGDKAAQAKGAPPIGEDSVVVRGPSAEVDRVVKEIQRIAEDAEQDAIVNGHVVEFQVDSTHIPHLVGRSGAAVTKLRNDLGVRVDFGEQDETRKKGSKTKITLTGRKESVEEAKKRLLSQTEKLADETTTTIKIPAHLHASMIGQGGKYVSRLQDTYAVRINFPRDAAAANGENGRARTEQKPDEVIIKGGKKGVEQAKQELVELLAYEQENNNVAEVPVSSKAIPRILGKAGANVNQLREDTGAQVDVDRDDDDKDVTTIRLRGTKQAIASAKSAILAIAKEVDAEASYTLHIDPAFHGQLIGPAGAAIRDLIIRCGGPSDAKASSQFVLFPRRGDKAADIVTVRGPADIANKIKTELEAASKALADRIVYGVAIAPSAQSGLVGRGGSRQRELQAKHNVVMILPGWKEYDLIAEPVNNAELGAASANSIIKILGAQEACEALAKEITSSFASVSKTVPVPRAVHTKLATPQFFRQLRNDFGVAVDTPRGGATANGASRPAVSSAAAAARIDADESAEDGLSWELEKLDLSGESPVEWTLTGKDEAALEKAERKIAIAVQKAGEFSHEGRLLVDRAVVPRIIGRGGAGLSAIQQDTGASVEIPRESGGLCIIRGSEEAVLAAKDRLVRIATSPARPRD